MATVIAPVDGYTGTVGRVRFLDGVGHTDDRNALRYFQRAGYTITEDTEPAPAQAEPSQPTVDDVTTPQLSGQDPHGALHLAQLPVSTPEQHDVEQPTTTASKAEWFEYLEANHPGHGLTIDHTKREMIAHAG